MAGVDEGVRESPNRGLYRRALEIQEQSGSPAPVEVIGGAAAAAPGGEVAAGGVAAGEGIDETERREIAGEIERLTARVPVQGDAFAFSSLRNGSLLPLVTNAASVVLIVVGLFALVRIFGGEEQSIVASTRGVVGAEGEVVAAIREESALRLAEKDREVEAALRRLRDLAAERDRIQAAAASAPAGSAQADARAAELERRIAEATAALDRARGERRALETAAAPAAPATPAAPAPQPLPEAARFTENEGLALERLAVGYRAFQEDAAARAWEAASRDLDEIEAMLNEGPTAGLPVIQRIRPLEASTVETLRGLLARLREEPAPPAPNRSDELLGRVAALARQAEARFNAGQTAAAETLYRAALSEVPEVRGSYERVLGMERRRWEQERLALNQRLQDLQNEVDRRQQALARVNEDLAREREGRRQEQTARADRVTSLTRTLREQQSGLASLQPDATGRVYDLLKTKALLKQVVDSPPVRAQYPELYDAMEQFFDRFGAEKMQAGEQTALASVVRSTVPNASRPTFPTIETFPPRRARPTA